MEGGSEAPAREGSSSTAVLASEMAEETNDNAKGEENGNEGGGVEEVEAEIDVKSSEPPLVREDQVQNAVNFLSHPKVRGSAVKFRRAFLERKGLSQAEIDEAFRRVPDPSPSMEAKGNEASGLSSKAGGESAQQESVGGGQTSALTTWKRPSQSRAQTGQQPTSVPRRSTSGSLSRHVEGRQQKAGTQSLDDPRPAPFLQKYPPLSQSLLVPPRRGFRWTQMVLAFGVVAAAGAGTAVVARNYFLPRLKSWIRHIASNDSDSDGESEQNRQKTKKPSAIEEAATAAAAAASAVTVMAKEMASSRTEEQKHRDALLRAIELQREDLSSAMTSLKDMMKTYNSVQASAAAEQTSAADGSLTVKDLRKELFTFASVMREATPGQPQDTVPPRRDVLQTDGQGIRSPPVYAGGNRGPRPESPAGSSVRQDVTRGDVQGSLSPPLYAVRQESPSDSPVHQAASSVGGKGEVSGASDESSAMQRQSQPPGADSSSYHAPHSKSYMEVWEMLNKGQKPPGIKDIDDKPPNPDQPLSLSQMKPLTKPWERPVSPESIALGTALMTQKKPSSQYRNWSPAASGPTQSRSSPEGSSYDLPRDFPKAVSVGAVTNTSAGAEGSLATDRIPWWRQNLKLPSPASSSPTASTASPIAVAQSLRPLSSSSAALGKQAQPQPTSPLSPRQNSQWDYHNGRLVSPPLSPKQAEPEGKQQSGNLVGRPRSPSPAILPNTPLPVVHPSAAVPSPQAAAPPFQIKEVAVDRTMNEAQSSAVEPTIQATDMSGNGGVVSPPSSIALTIPRHSAAEEVTVAVNGDLDVHENATALVDVQDDKLTDNITQPTLQSSLVVGAPEPAPRSTWSPPPAPKPILQKALAAMGYRVPTEEQPTAVASSEEAVRGKGETISANVPVSENGNSADTKDNASSDEPIPVLQSPGSAAGGGEEIEI